MPKVKKMPRATPSQMLFARAYAVTPLTTHVPLKDMWYGARMEDVTDREAFVASLRKDRNHSLLWLDEETPRIIHFSRRSFNSYTKELEEPSAKLIFRIEAIQSDFQKLDKAYGHAGRQITETEIRGRPVTVFFGSYCTGHYIETCIEFYPPQFAPVAASIVCAKLGEIDVIIGRKSAEEPQLVP